MRDEEVKIGGRYATVTLNWRLEHIYVRVPSLDIGISEPLQRSPYPGREGNREGELEEPDKNDVAETRERALRRAREAVKSVAARAR